MPQVEAEADIGDDHIVFDIGHQAVDEADMLDVLPGDDFDVQVVAQAVGVFFQEKAIRRRDPVPREEFQHPDDLVLGVEGQLVDQEQVPPDGDDERTVGSVSLIAQRDMGGWRGPVGIDSPETVADQIETALGAHQVKPGVQIQEFFDDGHGDPVKIFYGLIFLGQIIESF